MQIAFTKMHGAGNDFILVDDRTQQFPADDSALLRRMADRHEGVGCEGIILVQPSATADFRMRFFNPDGHEVEMCGNGARCAARFAHRIGAAPEFMTIDTVAGELQAAIKGERVRLRLTDPKDGDNHFELEVEGRTFDCGFVNSGVPHVVAFVDRVDDVDVVKYGAAIRHHARFAPEGTNANFVEVCSVRSMNADSNSCSVRSMNADSNSCSVRSMNADSNSCSVRSMNADSAHRADATTGDSAHRADTTTANSARRADTTTADSAHRADATTVDLRVRTYERGVEAETPACGTGMAAAALLAVRRGLVQTPVSIKCAFGEVLEVDFRATEDSATDVTLTGSAVVVFDGTLEYPRPVK